MLPGRISFASISLLVNLLGPARAFEIPCFSEVEQLAYSVVAHIPLVGTLYYVNRAEDDIASLQYKDYLHSLANCLESTVRDIVIVTGLGDVVGVTLIHSFTASFTHDVIDIFSKDTPVVPALSINETLHKDQKFLLVAGANMTENEALLFGANSKGVHIFFHSTFIGTLVHPKYSPTGTPIRLEISRGIYYSAPVLFTWIWDTEINTKRLHAERGIIVLTSAKPTTFALQRHWTAGGLPSYPFTCEIVTKAKILCYMVVGRKTIKIDFDRLVNGQKNMTPVNAWRRKDSN